ncbi:MAG TPA: histidine phosphatase family protein [Thermomicrobiales bacterium]|nr:histidine phosphatase family protein [Thermomicrobiales bacterium]
MRLLLIRHGQTRGNILNHLQGDDDPLTDLGRLQAQVTGKYLAANESITHLYSSPLARAFETASIIGRAIRHEPMIEPGLAELNIGIAAGTPFQAWAEANPHHIDQINDPVGRMDFLWEGGETGHAFRDRVFAAWDHIVNEHLGSSHVVAVVSHGGALGWIAAKIQGLPTDTWPADSFRNLSISEIDIDREGETTVIEWNRTTHLEEAGVTIT